MEENVSQEAKEKETLHETKKDVEEEKRPSIIEEARIERLKLEKDIEILKTERLKLQDLEVNRRLGGESGSMPPSEKPKEMSDEEYAEKALSGKLDLNDKK